MMNFPQRRQEPPRVAIVQVVLSPFVLLFRSLGWFYQHLGGQSLERWLARRRDDRFAKDVGAGLSTLLRARNAKVELPPLQRYRDTRFLQDEAAFIVAPDLRIRLSRWHGELSISATSIARPDGWEEVQSLLRGLDLRERGTLPQYPNLIQADLFQVGAFLELCWDRLALAVSEGSR